MSQKLSPVRWELHLQRVQIELRTPWKGTLLVGTLSLIISAAMMWLFFGSIPLSGLLISVVCCATLAYPTCHGYFGALRRAEEANEALQAAHERLNSQMAEIQCLQATLQEQAICDPLTGLHNRRYLDEQLQNELARAARSDTEVSLLMIDIDHFKRVNDEFGHLAGDMVLRTLGHLLRASTRGSDLACRYGGEELILVLPSASQPVAYQRAEALRDEFARLVFVHESQPLGPITLSVGVATFPADGCPPRELLQAADKALYEAKHAGRNRVVAHAQPA